MYFAVLELLQTRRRDMANVGGEFFQRSTKTVNVKRTHS
jgi:hypothetical protein